MIASVAATSALPAVADDTKAGASGGSSTSQKATTADATGTNRRINVYFATKKNDPNTYDISPNQALSGDSLNELRFPQLASVHLRLWVPRTAGGVATCKSEDEATDGKVRPEQATEQSGIRNRIYDFATEGDEPIVLPPLQYDIEYCMAIQGYGKNGPTVNGEAANPGATIMKGYFASRVSWPVSTNNWWAQRYVMPSVGVGITGWQSLTRGDEKLNAVAAPFLFVSAHVTPWPTDRRISFRERVHGTWAQKLHFQVGIAVTSPWPDVTVNRTAGAAGLLTGFGASFADNILGVSFGSVIGQAKYPFTDGAGIVHDRTQLLSSLTLNLSTQADIVGVIASALKGN